MIDTVERIQPRGIYLSEPAPESYKRINREKFSPVRLPKNEFCETQNNPLIPRFRSRFIEQLNFQLLANEQGVDKSVKVIKLPVDLSDSLTAAMISEMETLRDIGVLTSLRGGRFTDLSRPLSPEARAAISEHGQSLAAFIRKVEDCLAGTGLFVRTIKLDEARASTTQSDPDKSKLNLHFDAEKAQHSTPYFPGPIYQYFANISRLPRQFRIAPLTFPEIVAFLISEGAITEEQASTLPTKDIRIEFLRRTSLPLEEIVIETARLAIFDGKNFIHDGGKGRISDLEQGRFVPTEEPDLVLTLDTVKTGFHVGNYFPEKSFLDDPGTKSYWEALEKPTSQAS